MVCTKIKGEPIYEIVRSVSAHEELVVFYLLERIEDEILTRIQNTIYRQTMDSILEGQSRRVLSYLLDMVMHLHFTRRSMPSQRFFVQKRC